MLNNPISNNNIFIVNNGTIISEKTYAIYNYETGNVEINGGSVEGVTYGIVNDSGNIIITDGLVQGTTHGIINRGNLTITGGIIKGQYAINNNAVSKTLITGGEILSDYYINNNGNLEITGGKIYGKIDGIRMADLDTAVLTIGTNEENPSVDIEKTETYNEYLYEIPHAETVPEDYRGVFHNPVCAWEDFSLEFVQKRMIAREDAGDTETPRGNFSVLYPDGVLVHFNGRGTAVEIWEMFGSMEASKQ